MRALSRRRLFSALACSAALPFAARLSPARAAQRLRVAKVVPFAWAFTPLDIGMQTGIFAKHGLDIEESVSSGDAKLQQLLVSGSVDIGIGSGPGMAFAAKGAPAKAVAAMYGLPSDMAVMVGYHSGVKTVDDLKGKKLGVTTVGSLTAWIGQRINEQKNWDGNGIEVVPIGGMPPARAAIKMHQIDGYIGSLEAGYKLEEAQEWRVITTAMPFVEHFITHVLFARDELIDKQPDLVRAFLQGWFETIAYMRANKDKAVEISAKVIDLSPTVAARAYDDQMPYFSTDGRFDPQAIAALKKSFIEMGLLTSAPDDKVLFTTEFVPVKVDNSARAG
jgi:NitT/TauT family transport system substrate-binding protein